MTLTEFAKLIGVNKMTVSRGVSRGRLRDSVGRDPNGRPFITDPELAKQEWDAGADYSTTPPAVLEAVEQRRAAVSPPAESEQAQEGMSLSAASALEKVWKARQAEVNFRKTAGELIEVAAAERKISELITNTKTKLLGLPGRFKEAMPELTLDQIAVFERLIRESLEELSE